MKNSSSHEHNEHLRDLLVLCEKGNESAFKELYASCSEQLYGVIVRIPGIEANAEQVLQDSFVEIWLKAGTYKPASGSLLAWMSSIARAQALKCLTMNDSHESTEGIIKQGIMRPATPDQELTEDVRILIQSLDQLSENACYCIVQAYCEGYSHEELAVQLEQPQGKIKGLIRSGLLSLRKSVDEFNTAR